MKQPNEGYIYVIRAKSTPYYKVGYSDNPQQRARQINVATPSGAELLVSIKTNDMKGCEKYLQDFFRHHHHRAEWYALDDGYIKWLNELKEAPTVKELHEHLYVPF